MSQEWERLLASTITRPEELARHLDVDIERITPVHEQFPLRVNPYYLSLIKEQGDPIWTQAIPDVRELDSTGFIDPLAEEQDSPVPGIIHRYPDRVLFYVTHRCAVYCRHCTRKRKVANPRSVDPHQIRLGIEYIRDHPEVRDVIVSGGDPLVMTTRSIESIIRAVRAIPHVEIIRIGSRVPVTLPQRVTPDLCRMLKKYHPLYLLTHFNHPREVTQESARACSMLADAGIPLSNQSVLLRGVNNRPEVMKRLLQKLLAIRVRPYLIYLTDLVKGNDHFRTTVREAFDVISALRGHTSGLAVPHLVIDAPQGGGKIAIMPNSIVHMTENEVVLRNCKGKLYTYRHGNVTNTHRECGYEFGNRIDEMSA